MNDLLLIVSNILSDVFNAIIYAFIGCLISGGISGFVLMVCSLTTKSYTKEEHSNVEQNIESIDPNFVFDLTKNELNYLTNSYEQSEKSFSRLRKR